MADSELRRAVELAAEVQRLVGGRWNVEGLQGAQMAVVEMMYGEFGSWTLMVEDAGVLVEMLSDARKRGVAEGRETRDD